MSALDVGIYVRPSVRHAHFYPFSISFLLLFHIFSMSLLSLVYLSSILYFVQDKCCFLTYATQSYLSPLPFLLHLIVPSSR